MESVVKKLRLLIPDVTISAGESLHWSPEANMITYRQDRTDENLWGLIHEVGHAKLHHATYVSDMELLQLEVAAWDEAERIAESIEIKIDPDHIQDCLDTYRDWLHQRSTCPRCGVVCFQKSARIYYCHNCHKNWTVTASRFCRPYRLGTQVKNRPSEVTQTIFN